MHPTLPRLSTPEVEGVLCVSKALKHQVLLDQEEMAALFAHLGSPLLYCVSTLVTADQCKIEIDAFLDAYNRYITPLKEGHLPDERPLRPFFSAILTADPDTVYAHPVAGGKFLIKPLLPVIQLQPHHFLYSRVDQKFHLMVHGPESITFGIQFSYPQIYQDPKTQEFHKVRDLKNTALFHRLAQWIRAHTLPTPCRVENRAVNVSMRLGKKCLSWIEHHPQLVAQGICILKS